VRLDVTASRPLYLQLRDTLLHRIQAGDYVAHQRLPSERDLSEEFKVSRITVRQALADLALHGHVYTRVGKGTYVGVPSLHKPLGSLFGFSESVLQRGRRPSSTILEASLIPVPDDLVARLQITPGDLLVRLQRLRLVDDVPIAIESTHLPHAACPGLIGYMTHTASLYGVLETVYGLRMAFAEITAGAGLSDGEESRLLGLPPSSAVLRMEQTSFIEDGRPMEFSRASYRGDGYHFNAALYRARPPLPGSDLRDLGPREGRGAQRVRQPGP
jgi:GntR family transcriptional regulator